MREDVQHHPKVWPARGVQVAGGQQRLLQHYSFRELAEKTVLYSDIEMLLRLQTKRRKTSARRCTAS